MNSDDLRARLLREADMQVSLPDSCEELLREAAAALPAATPQPAPALPVEALQALAEKWRRLAGYEDEDGEPEQEAGSANRLLVCADELTALLATASKEPE